MATTTQGSTIEDWIVDNIKNLWLLGMTFKDAAGRATKELGFKISPRRISKLRDGVTMRLTVPFDEWTGRCRASGWSDEKWLTDKQWDHIGAWIMRNKEKVASVGDVMTLAAMARRSGVQHVNPHTMRAALSMWKTYTGYDPNLESEADGVANDQGTVGVSPVATVGAQCREDAALCKA